MMFFPSPPRIQTLQSLLIHDIRHQAHCQLRSVHATGFSHWATLAKRQLFSTIQRVRVRQCQAIEDNRAYATVADLAELTWRFNLEAIL